MLALLSLLLKDCSTLSRLHDSKDSFPVTAHNAWLYSAARISSLLDVRQLSLKDTSS